MLKKILLPVIAAATFALVAPTTADASPLSPLKGPEVLGGKVKIGVGIAVPIRSRRSVRHVRYEDRGYWKTVYETRVQKVWHAPEKIGYDAHGNPVYSEGHYEYVETRVPVRVWVSRPVRVIERGYYNGPVGHVRVGGVWRIR